MKELQYFSTRLPKEVKVKFMEIVEKEGYKVQGLMEKILKEWIEQQEKGGK